jgi:hypothetical protein
MYARTANPQLRSLAEIRPGESVRIEHILFDMLKDLCSGIGIAEGDVVRCRRTSNAVILLETSTGRTVILDGDWARFVEVRLLGAPDLYPTSAATVEASP